MNKKIRWSFVVIAIALFAIIVYATSDSDGGYNPSVRGTCTDDFNATFTDNCASSESLTEYFPSGSYCNAESVPCTCSNGACV